LNHADGYLEFRHSKARGSSRLYQQSWTPEKDVRAGILLVHGLGEHSSRYAHVAEHLTERGFAVHTLDHYGHGKSEGQPGYVERFSVFLDGVTALLHKVQSENPEQPLFLVGHSMGGLIAAAFLLEQQAAFRACVLSGPAIKSDQAPPAIVVALIRLIAILAPTAPLIQLDASGVSRDPDVVKAYMNDPLVHHGKLSARLLSEMSATMKGTLAKAGDIRIPILLMHGDADLLTAPSGSVELHAKVGSDDKTLILYPGLFHEIFNEPEQQAVLAELSSWLEARL